MDSQTKFNVFILTVLYSIQAIPLGLSMGTIPILLKVKASYVAIATFAISGYPYSLKLFWSPIVDSIYSTQLGKRKSWIIPAQTISGSLMLILSFSVDGYLSDPNSVGILTFMFTVFTFMSATQDIAVDAWGLEMFELGNRHLCATCQTIGMGIGFFISYTVFLFFNSAEFCNKYLRSTPAPIGLISLGQYLFFWGFVYLLVSCLLFLVPEHTEPSTDQEPILKQITKVYQRIWNILQLPNMKQLLPILLFNRLGTIALTLFPLHLATAIPQYIFAVSSVIGFPIEMIGAFTITNQIKDKPLDVYVLAYKVILGISGLALMLLYSLPAQVYFCLCHAVSLGWTHLCFVVLFLLAFRVTKMYMFVSLGAFFSSISDSSIGGTYVTLINTISNFGVNIGKLDCSSTKTICSTRGGTCDETFDGFYPISILCIIFGLFMVHFMTKQFLPLQFRDYNTWSDEPYDVESGVKQFHDD